MASGRLTNTEGQTFYPSPFWPIGSIFINTVNENPSKYFGGTWEQFGAGRCLVGVDTSQTEFNQVEKTGGSKYLQKHTHLIPSKRSIGDVSNVSGDKASAGGTGSWCSNNNVTGQTGDGNSGNLQPYITVYMWKRTA